MKRLWITGAFLAVAIAAVAVWYADGPEDQRDVAPVATPPAFPVAKPEPVETTPVAREDRGPASPAVYAPFDREGILDLSLIYDDPGKRNSMRQWLDRASVADKQHMAGWKMAAEDLRAASTEDVILHVARSPVTATFSIHNDRNFGITRVLHSSATLQEFFCRKDVPSAILAVYRDFDLDPPAGPAGTTVMDYVRLSMTLSNVDKIVMYPPMFARLESIDRAILEAMHERLKKVVPISERLEREGKDEGHGFVLSTTRQLVLMVVESSAPNLHGSLQDTTSSAELSERLGDLLAMDTP